jgi:hypothetical protein
MSGVKTRFGAWQDVYNLSVWPDTRSSSPYRRDSHARCQRNCARYFETAAATGVIYQCDGKSKTRGHTEKSAANHEGGAEALSELDAGTT